MNALIFPYTRGFGWCEEFFPERSLCSLPAAGKPLAEYLLDFCSLLNVSRAVVQDYCFDSAYRERLLQKSAGWPLELTYAGASLCPDVIQLAKRNAELFTEDGLLIFRGALLPMPEKPSGLLELLEACPPGECDEDGIYLYRPGGELRRYTGPVWRIAGLKDYYELNFRLLKSPGCYSLPGYSAENGVHAGIDAAIKPKCRIEAPVMLGDHICLERGCILKNGVVVGDGSLIDAGTVLDHTIVLDNTFVGMNMDFHDKIVSGGRIIDVAGNTYVDQKDVGISSGMRFSQPFDFCTLLERLLMLLFAAAGLVPWLLLRKSGLRRKLSLDRYPRVWDALLHGGRLIRRSPQDRHYVLCASEGYGNALTPEQKRIDDLYYRHHITPVMVLRLTCNSILRRGLGQ